MEGINRDDPGRDDMPPAKSPRSPRYGGGRGFGEESGLGPGRAAPPTDDGERDWRRAMRGQDTSGYGGQYAGLVAGCRGQGPKGYVRRDERIHEDVCERLSRDEELDSRDIDVRVEAGVVTLEGTVTARWARRHAEDLAMVSGVREVRNNLRVRGGRDA